MVHEVIWKEPAPKEHLEERGNSEARGECCLRGAKFPRRRRRTQGFWLPSMLLEVAGRQFWLMGCKGKSVCWEPRGRIIPPWLKSEGHTSLQRELPLPFLAVWACGAFLRAWRKKAKDKSPMHQDRGGAWVLDEITKELKRTTELQMPTLNVHGKQ